MAQNICVQCLKAPISMGDCLCPDRGTQSLTFWYHETIPSTAIEIPVRSVTEALSLVRQYRYTHCGLLDSDGDEWDCDGMDIVELAEKLDGLS